MSKHASNEIASRLVGHRLIQIKRREYDWSFEFGDDLGLGASCPWRILVDGRIACCDSDHNQTFGLPKPLNVEEVSNHLTQGKSVQDVVIREGTGDLIVVFEQRTTLEVLNMSVGYEGWQLSVRGSTVIALGGGELAIINKPSH